jgi:hypothetical protein
MIVPDIVGLTGVALVAWLTVTAFLRVCRFPNAAWIAAPLSWLLASGVAVALLTLEP